MFVLPLLSSAILLALLFVFVFSLGQNPIFRRFSILAATTIWWHGSWVWLLLTKDEGLATQIAIFGHIGILYLPVAYRMLYFAVFETEKSHRWTHTIYLFLVVCLLTSRTIIDGVNEFAWGFYPNAGIFHPLFLIFIAICVAETFVHGLLLIRRTRHDKARLRSIKTALIAAGIFVAGSFDFLLNYKLISFYPIGFLTCIIFMIVNAAGIVRRDLFQKENAIERTAQRLFKIFESTGHAIFAIERSPDGSIVIARDARSPYAQELLSIDDSECPLVKSVFFENLDVSEERRVMIMESLEAFLQEAELTYDLNIGHLPDDAWFTTMSGEKRHLSIRYAPIIEKEGVVSSLIVTALDDTKAVQMKAEAQATDEAMFRINTLLTAGKDHSLRGIAWMSAAMESIQAEIRLIAALDVKEQIERYFPLMLPLHTVKGNARTLGLQDISEEAHRLESVIVEMRSGQSAIDPEMCSQILKMLSGYLEAFQSLGWSRDSSEFIIPKAAYMKALQHGELKTLKSIVDDDGDTDGHLEVFLSFHQRRVRHLRTPMREAGVKAAKLAGKQEPIIHIQENRIWLPAGAFETVVSLLPHLVANAIDHGLESASDRRALGKETAGSIFLRATHVPEEEVVELAVSDDGRGINPDLIAKVAIERGMVDEVLIANWNEIEKVNLIFKEGFSNRSEVSSLSGRGVGLSAVASDLKKIGGEVKVRFLHQKNCTTAGWQGFEFVLIIPLGNNDESGVTIKESLPSPDYGLMSGSTVKLASGS